jgi:hypothetical protein
MEEKLFEPHGLAKQLIQGKIAVFVIAQDRVTNHSQMPPYLMHAACSQRQF